MEKRNFRAEAGLDDRPVVLVCGDSGALPTGVARVIRGICQPIMERGKFQVIQHGWFHIDSANIPVNYRIIPIKRHPQAPGLFDTADKWGQESFDDIVSQLKPDIVFAVADYTRVDHIRKSKHRNDWSFIHYIPLDTFPPNQLWREVVQSPDIPVYYTEVAKQWGEQAEAVGPHIPHGVETDVYAPTSPEQRRALRQKFFGIPEEGDYILIGSVGRNQRRKRHDQLIQAFSHLYHGGYSTCTRCNQVTLHKYVLPGGFFEPPAENVCSLCLQVDSLHPGQPWPHAALYLHTDPTEPGGDAMPLNKLCMMYNVEDPVKFNPQIDLRLGKGLSNEMMASFYQCMDLYVHPADGGGWELTPMEAGACGVPVVAVDAPAQNEWLAKMPGCLLTRAEIHFRRELDGNRSVGLTHDLVLGMLTYMKDKARRQVDGAANTAWAQGYTWNQISEQWEGVFRDALDPAKNVERWRVLVDA